MRGRDMDPEAAWWDDVLWLNSRAEAKHLMLTDVRCLRTIIKNLKAHETEFLFLDVLKVLHDSDENDSQEMGKVLKCSRADTRRSGVAKSASCITAGRIGSRA